MKIYIKSELKNIAPRFNKAIWRKYNIMREYASSKEARKFHNLKNCCYEYKDKDDNVIRSINHARIDAYGTRFN